MKEQLQPIFDSILEGDSKSVVSHVTNALEAGFGPGEILNEGMIPAMQEVGSLFEQGEYYVPEMLISARAMKEGLALLKPLLSRDNVQAAGKIAIGTVKGDLHDIGKNLVGMMLEGAGYQIIDLGTDVSPEKFVNAVVTEKVDVIALSALLTTTMPNMKVTIDALERAGLRNTVKVIVGGAPVTDVYASQIGADGFSPDASRAVNLVKLLLVA